MKTTRPISLLTGFAVALTILASVPPASAQIVSYDFSTASQFDDNFTVYSTGTGTTAWNAGEFVRSDTAAGGYQTALMLDGFDFTTPSLTLQTDFRFATTTGAFSDYTTGFYFASNATDTDALLLRFTARSGGADSVRFRIYDGVDPSTVSGESGPIFDTTVSTGGGGQPPNIATNTWYTLRLDYEIVGGNQIPGHFRLV